MPFVAGAVWEDRPRIGCDRCVAECWDGPMGPHLKSCGCPCAPEGCKHAASWAVQDRVTEAQRRIRERYGVIVIPRRRAHFRAIARWNELEAERRYSGMIDEDGLMSWERDLRAARNYRWLVELMDAGRRVTSDGRGVYIDGELASKAIEREQRAEQRKRQAEENREAAARREAERPDRVPCQRRGARSVVRRRGARPGITQ